MSVPTQEKLAEQIEAFSDSVAPARERWAYCLDRSTYTYRCADGRVLHPISDASLGACDRIIGCYRGVADIEQREEAQRIAERAADLSKQAKRADKAATVGTGLRTSWVPILADRNAAIKHYWAKDPKAFERLVLDMAVTEVRQGVRSIPGFVINEVKGAI